MTRDWVLSVEGLAVHVGTAALVRDVSFSLPCHTMRGLVGESGSGKTTVARALAGLNAQGATVFGRARFGATPWAIGTPGPVALIPQEALSSLNPVVRVGAQVLETLAVHQRERATMQRAIELLELVGLERVPELTHAYPHQLSGGMRQRVLIAAALACAPKVLVADEPTTALDREHADQVMHVLKSLSRREAIAVLVITHDLVTASFVDTVSVMYAGRVVEEGDSSTVLTAPRHPYTQALLAARPGPNMTVLRGQAPGVDEVVEGCSFRPRCSRTNERCARVPPLVSGVACAIDAEQ